MTNKTPSQEQDHRTQPRVRISRILIIPPLVLFPIRVWFAYNSLQSVYLFTTQFIFSRAANWFCRVYFHLVTIAAKGKQTSKDKENNSSSSTNSRAIVAVSITQKQSSVLNKNLKNQEKKASALTSESSKPSSSKADPKVVKPVAVSDMTGKKAHMTSIGHRQFEQAEVQKKRKEQLIQKLKEQEQKELKFQFHAKAAPKVKKVVVAQKQTSVEERKIVKQKSLPHITLSKKMSRENVFPSCGDPERLKSIIEKKKMLVAKYQETQVQFKAKPATVLKKQPFQPVHNNVKVVDPKPFKLQLTTRLLQRSEFDKKLHETITIRKLQEEKFKRQQDAEILKKNRQKTEFRANPIRSYHKL